MFIVNVKVLEKSDIILSRHDDRLTEEIKIAINSDYSHASLYVGNFSCIESHGAGVQSQNINRLLFENISDVVILRTKNKIHNLESIINYARQMIGMEYSPLEARRSMNNPEYEAREPNRQFCTRFVAKAFATVGINLVNNADYCTPNDLLNSSLLIKIDNPLIRATKEQIEYASEKNLPLEEQVFIQGKIFEASGLLTGKDIQTWEQLIKHVLENPKDEQGLSNILKNSGYLEFWETDVKKNPHYYDYALLSTKSKSEIEAVGKIFVDAERENKKRLLTTLEALKYYYSLQKQDFFKIQISLYEKLLELSNQREHVAKKALE